MDPFTEFVGALKIIEKTQLTLSVETTLPGIDDTIAEYREAAKEIDSSLDNAEQKRIDIMRDILVKALDQYNDKYANYIYPDALKRYNARRNGKLSGVGLKYRVVKEGLPLVIGPLLGGPMDGTDVRPGDRLASIDDTSVSGLSAKDIASALKGSEGSEGSSVNIGIMRGDDTHTLDVKRCVVGLEYADAHLLDRNVGYIKISRFGAQTHLQVGELLAELMEQGAQGVVLDMRDNPGGSTRAARAIVSLFCTQDTIYCEKNKADVVTQMARLGDHKSDLPLAVLINGDSMSCSEVVAGALKTYNRATIVGAQSFGKGLVQRVFTLAEPLGGAVRTTIASMLQPDMGLIHAKGIEPDVAIKTDYDFMFRRTGSLNISAQARQYQRSVLESDVRKKKLKRALEYIEAKDMQLQAAIDSLFVER